MHNFVPFTGFNEKFMFKIVMQKTLKSFVYLYDMSWPNNTPSLDQLFH